MRGPFSAGHPKSDDRAAVRLGVEIARFTHDVGFRPLPHGVESAPKDPLAERPGAAAPA